MNHTVARILSCFILNKEKRKKIRNKLMGNVDFVFDKKYELAMKICDEAINLVDIGCGPNPHKNSKVAIDPFIEPVIHRDNDVVIDVNKITQKGCKFVKANCENIPFENKFFDVSYSSHMIEHVDDPILACQEIMRVSKKGVILSPNIFAEHIFGRTFHKWFVLYRENLLIFIEKSDDEIQPLWGDIPKKDGDKYKFNNQTNPFEILLNDGNWYKGKEKMPRISNKLKQMYYSHHPAIENVFIWENQFSVLVIYQNGSTKRLN